MADNFNHNLEILNRNIELLADKMGGSDTFDSGNIAHLGNFVQALSDLKSLGKGEILNVRAIEQQIHSSLASLQSTVADDTKQIIQKIQSQMTGIFNSTTDDFQKHLVHIGNNLHTLKNDYTAQIIKMQQNGAKLIRTHTDVNLRGFQDNIEGANEAYLNTIRNGLVAISGKAAMSQKKLQGKVIDYELSVDSIMKDIEQSSGKIVSERKAALKKIIKDYYHSGYINSDTFDATMSATKKITGTTSSYLSESVLPQERQVITNQFKNIAQTLVQAIQPETKKMVEQSRRGNFDTEMHGYGTDKFYLDSPFINKLLNSSSALRNFVEGSYFNQRVQKVGGQVPNHRMTNMMSLLSSMMSTMDMNGIGTYFKPYANGEKIDIGFFDEKKRNDIFSMKNGSRVADWSKMAKITLGIPNADGNIVSNGLDIADKFIHQFSFDKDLPISDISTVSEEIWKNILSGVTHKGFIEHIKEGSIRKANQFLGNLETNVVNGLASNATYATLSSDVADELSGDRYAGTSKLRQLLRSNTVSNAPALQSIYKKIYKPTTKSEMSNSDLEQMIDYVVASATGAAQKEMLLSDQQYSWLKENNGTHYLDLVAKSLKNTFPHWGISSKKEMAYLTGDVAGIDVNALNPFHVINPGINRSISQGGNGVKRAHNASKMRTSILRSPFAEQFGIDYNNPTEEIFRVAEATDSEIRAGLSSYYNKLVEVGNRDELVRLYQKHILGKSSKLPKKMSNEEIAGILSSRHQMPSTFEGGAIASSDFALRTEGSRPIRKTITFEDLQKLGVTQIPTEANPVLLTTDEDDVGSKLKKGLQLSNGITLKSGDRIRSVSYMGEGNYQLSYEELMPHNRYSKYTSKDGDRVTFNTNLTPNEMQGIAEHLGLSLTPDVFVEPTKTDGRKLAGLTQGKYEEVFQRIHDRINAGIIDKSEVIKYVKNDPMLSKMIDFDGNIAEQKIFNMQDFQQIFSNVDDVVSLYNTYDQNGTYAKLIKQFLDKKDFNELMSRNIRSTTFNKSDEHEYFDPIGFTSKEVAERTGHYKQTPLLRSAIARIMSQASIMGDNSDDLISTFRRYGALDPNDEFNLTQLSKEFTDVYNKTVGKKVLSTKKSMALNLDDNVIVRHADGTIDRGDFDNTVLGRAWNNNKETYIDLGETFRVTGEKGGYIDINKVAIPRIKPMENKDGNFMPYDIEQDYARLEKDLFHYNELKDAKYTENDTVYSDARNRVLQSLEKVIASQYNAVHYKEGFIRKGLNNTRLTNSAALKTEAINLGGTPEQIQALSNTAIVHPDTLKGMLSVGRGGDLTQGIDRLLDFAEGMYIGDNDLKILNKIQSWAEEARGLINKGDNKSLKRAKKIVDKMGSQITADTDIENGSNRFIPGTLFRNPLIAGDDLKFVRYRTSKGVEKGHAQIDPGLATAIAADFDGDTLYASLPLSAATSKEEFQSALKSFNTVEGLHNYVNSALREFVLSDYQKTTSEITSESSKMEDVIRSFYAHEGKDNFLQNILSKKNFQYVGQLDNFAKGIMSTLSSGLLDELSHDPIKAAQSIITRSLFEQMTQDAISSKKVGSRIESHLQSGENVTDVYAKELGLLDGILAKARNLGSADYTAKKFTEDLSGSQLFKFDEANKHSIRAISTIEYMLKSHFGKNVDGYRQAMTDLGIWDSRLDRKYGLHRGEKDQNTEMRGVIASGIYGNNLTNVIKNFERIFPGQNFAAHRYGELAKNGQYEQTAQKIVDNITQWGAKSRSEGIRLSGEGLQAPSSPTTPTIVSGKDGNYITIKDLVATNNPMAGLKDYRLYSSKLINGSGNIADQELVDSLAKMSSDAQRAEKLGFSNTHDYNSFKQYMIKNLLGQTVHSAHETGDLTGTKYFKSFLGTSDTKGIAQALGVSESEIENLINNAAYRYASQAEADKFINQDLQEQSIQTVREANVEASAFLRDSNLNVGKMKGRSDLVTLGTNAQGKKIVRVTDYKNIAKEAGIAEFEQAYLNEIALREMHDYAQELLTDPSKSEKSALQAFRKRYGNKWNKKTFKHLAEAEDFDSVINATDANGVTHIYRRTNSNIGTDVVRKIRNGEVLDEAKGEVESVKQMYTEQGSFAPQTDGQGAKMASHYGQQLTNDEMISQYRAFMGEKLAIDQNYATVKAQLSGMSDRDPDRKVLEKRLEALQSLRKQYNSISYGQDKQGNLVRMKNGEVDAWTTQNDTLIEQFNQINKGADVHNKTMLKMAGINNRVTKTLAGLSSQFKGMLSYYAMYGVVQKIIGSVMQTFQKFIQTVKELDQALVNLEIVTTKSRNELQESVEGYMDIAHNMGRTTTEVMSAANDWLRAGYDIEDANLLIQDSLKLSTLGMIDAEKATESLLSTMKGWKLTAEEVSGVVDSLTALDVEYATTAGDIATAMAKGNVSASLAGVDMSNYQAYLTTVLDVSQQSAETVGTAFKTLFARYGNVKAGKYAENYNFGESDSEANDETTKLNDVETVLNKVDIKTRSTVGEFREMDEVLDEVAEKWSSFDKVTKNAITTAMAGKIVARTYSNVWLSGI